jgi:hypothetical protein
MIIANLSNLCWANGQRRRNQAIFSHLLESTDSFEEGFYLQTPLVKTARTFQFSRSPELEEVSKAGESQRKATVLQPVLMLPNGYPPAATQRAVTELRQKIVKRYLRGRPYLLWINSITHFQAQLAEELMPGAEFRVFDSSDLLMMYRRNGGERFRQVSDILNKCDVALCSSDQAMAETAHPAKFLVPDCSENLFFASGSPPLHLPPLFPKGAGAVYIGFTGVLTEERTDFDLLHALFLRFPSYQFVFVGSTTRSSSLSLLNKYPNFHHIPGVQDEVLTSMIPQLDVAIIPDLPQAHERNMDGHRTFDYIRCGIPVLSTNVPKNEKLLESVHVARSVWEFSHQLERLVKQPNSHDASSSFDVAGCTWELLNGPLKALFAKNLQLNIY